MRCCPAVQKNRLAFLNQITAGPTDHSLSVDVLDEPGHDISLRRRPSTNCAGMSPLHQPLLFQDAKIFPQRWQAQLEDRRQFIQMDAPASCDERADLLLSLGGKKGSIGSPGHGKVVHRRW